MGAVFAMFSGWYFWVPKLLGLNYNMMSSKAQFWVLFIGVNRLAPSQFCLILGIAKNYLFLRIIIVKILLNNHKQLSWLLTFMGIWMSTSKVKINNLNFNLFLLITNYLKAKLVEVKNLMWKRNLTVSFLNQKASQRLNAKDIQWFVGFTDGDGCLSVYKEKKYPDNLRHEYSIGLEIADIKLLYKLKSFLGCGTVRKYNNVAIFRIKKIQHILYIILPIFDQYPLLTENKRDSYLNFRNSFLSKVINSKRATIEDKNFAEILLSNAPYNFYKLPIKDLLLKLDGDYFDNWLVGFTEAEGSFYFIKNPKDNGNLRAEFRISQNNNQLLLTKIKDRLNLTREVALTTNSKNHYYILAGSIKTIQEVINFFKNPFLVKLKGKKYLNYILWLKGIKSITRYKNIKV
jgi:hypothetical protein